ncbi:MAG: DUF302 domain-containing protein [Acidobacteriaceae bacterium]|nr:DUF302 domain-containing protein [Acidobacteriaceae bacterium]
MRHKQGENGIVNAKGIVTQPSSHSVEDTVALLLKILDAKGLTLFVLIDHSGEAAKIGMTMRPTKLLIFGDPKAGTPIMLAAPSSALDLPLKILVYEDDEGIVRVAYNDPAYLEERHGIPATLLPNIAGIAPLVAKISQ